MFQALLTIIYRVVWLLGGVDMKVVLFFILIAFFKASLAFSSSQRCQNLEEFLRQPQHQQDSIKTSLTQMLSFEYLRHVFTNHFHSQDLVCSQVLSLSKGQYQYYRYMIELLVIPVEKSQSSVRFYYYFQDASTQAFHNYVGKPWVGLEPKRHQKFMNYLQQNLANKLDLAIQEKKNFVEKVSSVGNLISTVEKTRFFRAHANGINRRTISVWKLDSRNVLVTWMKSLSSSSNPFLNSEISQGLYLRYDENEKAYFTMPFFTSFESVVIAGKEQNLFEHLEENLLETSQEAQTKDWTQFLFDLGIKTL